MEDHAILKDLLIVFAVSGVAVFLFQRLKVPSVVGLLVAGMVVGPYGLGLVGEVASVRPEAVLDLVQAGRIPVISSIAPDADGTVHNVNADLAAAALAVALEAEKLLVLTDVEGLYLDWPDPEEVIGEISPDSLEAILPDLASGMIPKMEGCLHAVSNGVRTARVIDGRVKHSILLEIFTNEGIGTMVVPDETRSTSRMEAAA